jgi:hypothetical protein
MTKSQINATDRKSYTLKPFFKLPQMGKWDEEWFFSVIVSLVRYLFTSSETIQKFISSNLLILFQLFQSKWFHNQLALAKDPSGKICNSRNQVYCSSISYSIVAQKIFSPFLPKDVFVSLIKYFPVFWWESITCDFFSTKVRGWVLGHSYLSEFHFSGIPILRKCLSFWQIALVSYLIPYPLPLYKHKSYSISAINNPLWKKYYTFLASLKLKEGNKIWTHSHQVYLLRMLFRENLLTCQSSGYYLPWDY